MPRQFGLVPMPQGPDPLQTLSGMMGLAANMEGYQDARRQREEAERIKQTVAASGGDPMAAADTLAREGHIGPAMQLRDSANVSATRAMGARAQANEVQQQEGQMRDASAARSIMSKALRKGENGLTTFDRDLLTQEFTTAGLGHQLPELFKGLDEADAASLKFSEARREAVAGIAYGIHSAGNTPQALQLGIDYALANGLATERELVPLRRAAQADPKQIASITQGLFAQSPKFAQLQGDEADRAARGEATKAAVADRAADNARQAAAAAEAARHNRAMEARTTADGGAGWSLQQVTDPSTNQTRLVRVNSRTGESQEVPLPDGMQPGGQRAPRLTAGQQDDLATMDTVVDLADLATKVGDEIGWKGVGGLGAGSASSFMAKNFGAGTEKEENLRNYIGNIQGTIAKLRGGTAFSAAEKSMLDSYTPTINDSDMVIKSKLKSMKEFIDLKKKNTLQMAGADPAKSGQSVTIDPQTRGGANLGKSFTVGRFQVEVSD